MAMETSNLNASYDFSPCIPWLVASIAECLAIVILNLFTIIVFVKQRHLQRRSTYLIIHMAIIDLLAGAVSGPLIVYDILGLYCDLRKETDTIYPLAHFFPMASIVNLAVISLERMHVTIFPFEHRVIERRVYGIVIAAIWFLTSLREIVDFVLYETQGNSHLAISFSTITLASFGSLSLILICVSYISIFIQVRFSPTPQQHGATNRESKLTATILIATFASLLTWLPVTTFRVVKYLHVGLLSGCYTQRFSFHIKMTLAALVGANSLANPIVYAIRMPEFRAGIVKMFCRSPSTTSEADIIYL
ncbi:adenosine receptor A3-like [Stylophora pistillata]|uniref:adenosine receptor A3-like n=1 Tax=Stylophora pistillata TaxID=50429 RepID=UPI000C04F733|nr:adenosine receptor A3-like [Stylophora pistillata]XP_022796680.1 adenosine receptor A3-like [Stylophora pistillata]XP_022796681.1 adenosine receptor A3-like [Stylophora pistillata]XP_022796682.1 adenosine receptor A3-like [Stylophora pistillata]XP_022796683.1 adenosine receptor A3-like [Stylophora pistillata]XP_022796684.1 adenosine receptor A3-like [Stylophora pistillata]XP_022796685.1 adenosine receptor A3-like [Stylophora pistillata]XP_022796686.1 adenosine receptor A3-like [Stylophora